MDRIIENRQILVKNKVISISNVQAIAKFMANEAERQSQSEREKVELRLVARCDDGSSFQSEGIEVFNDDSRIWQRRVIQISAAYSHYPTKARMDVSLRHGDSDATITVSGTDRIWVAGMAESLARLLESFPHQRNLYMNHKRLIDFVIAMGMGSIIAFLISLFSSDLSSEGNSQTSAWLFETIKQYPFIKFLIKYSLVWLMGWPWTELVTGKLKRLWPSIELQLGPDHLLEEKQRRKVWGSVLVLGVLPLSLTLFYDLMKYWSGH